MVIYVVHAGGPRVLCLGQKRMQILDLPSHIGQTWQGIQLPRPTVMTKASMAKALIQWGKAGWGMTDWDPGCPGQELHCS